MLNIKRFFHKPGSIGYAPGTLVASDKTCLRSSKLTIFQYGSELPVEEHRCKELSDWVPFNPLIPVNWLNIGGGREVNRLEEFGRLLDIHPLVLEIS